MDNDKLRFIDTALDVLCYLSQFYGSVSSQDDMIGFTQWEVKQMKAFGDIILFFFGG